MAHQVCVYFCFVFGSGRPLNHWLLGSILVGLLGVLPTAPSCVCLVLELPRRQVSMTAPSSEFSLSCVDGCCEDRGNQALGISCSVLKHILFVLLSHGNFRKIRDHRTKMAVTGCVWGCFANRSAVIRRDNQHLWLDGTCCSSFSSSSHC